jgi:Flp pilus assembly protein TadG
MRYFEMQAQANRQHAEKKTIENGSRGQTLVEWGLTLPVLLLLVISVIEFSFLLQAYVTIQHSADQAARYASTGEGWTGSSGDTARESQIIQVTKSATYGIPVVTGAAANEAGYLGVSIRSSRSDGNPATLNAGGPDEFVTVDITFNHRFITPMLESILNYVRLKASTTVINERFARPDHLSGGVPQLPPPMWTPVP